MFTRGKTSLYISWADFRNGVCSQRLYSEWNDIVTLFHVFLLLLPGFTMRQPSVGDLIKAGRSKLRISKRIYSAGII